MTDRTVELLVAASVAAPLLSALALQLVHGERRTHHLNTVFALISAATGCSASATIIGAHQAHAGAWFHVDAAAGVYVGVVTAIALMSALLSPAYLRDNPAHFFRPDRSVRRYYLALYGFWSALVAIPVAANLGIAWLIVEATTAASAVLVAASGKPRALEAGWKYLVLTTLGLSLAFFGVVVMLVTSGRTASGIGQLDWSSLPSTLGAMPHDAALAAYALVMLGLAGKIGWAPLQNWLPDAHSEAPAPVSALLSSALLPAVMLLAWRLRDAAADALGTDGAAAPVMAFGLLSVAVAVPFLWQPMAWKRLMAYHTLEHMGIITVGIAIGGPLALAGVVLHVSGHALAKALGFYAAMPLFQLQPHAARHSARDVASASPATFVAMLVTAATLGGMPPTPLFFSELFIILGGVQAGHVAVAVTLAVLIALAYVGLLHALLEAAQHSDGAQQRPGVRHERERANARTVPIVVPTVATAMMLTGLSAWALTIPGSHLARELARGIA